MRHIAARHGPQYLATVPACSATRACAVVRPEIPAPTTTTSCTPPSYSATVPARAQPDSCKYDNKIDELPSDIQDNETSPLGVDSCHRSIPEYAAGRSTTVEIADTAKLFLLGNWTDDRCRHRCCNAEAALDLLVNCNVLQSRLLTAYLSWEHPLAPMGLYMLLEYMFDRFAASLQLHQRYCVSICRTDLRITIQSRFISRIPCQIRRTIYGACHPHAAMRLVAQCDIKCYLSILQRCSQP